MRNAYDKWLAGEGCCNANNFIHIESADCKKEDVCECERILLEISNLHTDDLVLQEQIDELSGDVANKLDASAYTPVDLSDYYTKEQVDALIPEVPSLSGYATEQWVLDKHYITGVDLSDYATKEEIPSLSGYATEQWVENKGYLTEHQPLKTINNQVISGTGNITISAETPDLSNYYTKQETYNKQEVNNLIPSLTGYATEQWVSNNYQVKGNYLTEHQPLKTINGQVISGTGNIEITASGGTIDVDYVLDSGSTNPVVNSAITVAINSKLDASAYTPTEQVQSDWNVTDSASTAYIKNKPTIPSLDGYATTGYVQSAVSGKQDTLSAGTGIDITDNVVSTRIGNGLRYTQEGVIEVNSTNAIASGNTQVPLSYVVYTYVNNNCMMKSQIWCGTQAEYDALSPKQNDVLYLIHE